MKQEPDLEAGAPQLHHLALRAKDVVATVRFYTDVLGLREVRSDLPRSIWLGLGAGAVLMVEAREKPEPAIAAGSLELFALRVSAQRRAAIREVARTNNCLDGETAHTVYLRDPDGRRVGVSTYPF